MLPGVPDQGDYHNNRKKHFAQNVFNICHLSQPYKQKNHTWSNSGTRTVL